jgi:lipopolysaccharide export system protein LptA
VEPARFEAVEVQVGEGPDASRLALATAWASPDGAGGGTAARATAPGWVVTGDRSSWSLSSGEVHFDGHVRAEHGTAVLTADALTLGYADTRLTAVHAIGGVRLVQGARLVTATEARLDVPTGALRLTGAPQLVEGGRRLMGEVVTLWLDDDRLTCERCRLELPDPPVAAVGAPVP